MGERVLCSSPLGDATGCTNPNFPCLLPQPGTQLTQDADGKIYVTQEDGTTAPLDSQESSSVPYETVESLLSLEGQQQQQ